MAHIHVSDLVGKEWKH